MERNKQCDAPREEKWNTSVRLRAEAEKMQVSFANWDAGWKSCGYTISIFATPIVAPKPMRQPPGRIATRGRRERHAVPESACVTLLWTSLPDKGVTNMNWDTMKGQWKQFRGQVKEQWGKLTDDDLDRIEGKRDQLLGAVQKRYGIARDEAERQLREFESTRSGV
jgi:uncharacterized protein YjbJ (UPF0337 family)